MKYKTILADPPWPYDTSASGSFAIPKPLKDVGTRGVEAMGYDGMAMADLLALRPPAEDNAHVYIWTTNAFMVEAHELCRAWGFKPKTILTWGKTHQNDPTRASMKTGYYFRGATEHVVFGVRGSLRLNGTFPTLYLWPRIGQHSVKPDEFYDVVEQASPGPYLELFARRQRPGWNSWGNECRRDVSLGDLPVDTSLDRLERAIRALQTSSSRLDR